MGRLLRLIVGLTLTAIVFWLADPIAVVRAAAAARLSWIAAAVLLVIPDRALMAYRWLVLLQPIDPARRAPLGAVLKIFFVSTFVGTFLPSVGGDAARAYGLSRHGIAAADAAASVLMDRLMGVWSLLLIALPGVALSEAVRRDAGVLTAVAITAAACAAAALVLFSVQAAEVLKRALALLPGGGLRRSAERLLDSVRRYRNHRAVLANVTIGSLAVQAIRVLQSYCIGVALGIPTPLVVYFALIPVILLILLIPVTINGLGTAQLAFVWLFGRVGVPGAEAFALSVLAVSLGIVGNLPGGVIFTFGGARRRDARPSSEAGTPRGL
ncbi:MAG TPA: lysylphosphatidylglycerol synthase transmembrane domain-containing protein [Vicinamibacterales bacterium]|nr:lysylphosphatidylglycerol synthase transmembrane domain-containing protein [Vicinamibacterales bacterium]